MDSIHKTVMIGFLRAFHTDVQNASKLSKSWVAHTYQRFLLYRQMANLPWVWEKARGEVLAQKCQTTISWFIKSWSMLFAACSEPILRTWPNSHRIHQASVGTGTCLMSEKELFSGMKQNNSWVGVKRHGKRKEISVLLNFLHAIVLKNITRFIPWKRVMSDWFLVDRNCHNCDTVISDLFVPWSFILSREGDV